MANALILNAETETPTPSLQTPPVVRRRRRRKPQTDITKPKVPPGSRANAVDFVPVGWHTRKQVAARLGVTSLQLNVLVAQGHIISGSAMPDGKPLFSDAAIAEALNKKKDGSLRQILQGAVAKRNSRSTVALPTKESSPIVDLFPTEYTKEQGIKAARMLRDGVDPLEIAIELDIHIPLMKHLIFDICDVTGSAWIPKSILDQMNAVTNLPGVYPMGSATDVLKMLQSCAEARRCPSCQKGTCADECSACIEDRTVRALELRAQRERERREAARAAAAAATPSGSAESTSSSAVPVAVPMGNAVAADLPIGVGEGREIP